MPVPSTITELRLTTVWMPRGRVVSATARIIGIGPIAQHVVEPRAGVEQLLQAVGHEPLVAVRAVVGGDDRARRSRARISSSRMTSSRVRPPRIDITWLPAFFRATAVG